MGNESLVIVVIYIKTLSYKNGFLIKHIYLGNDTLIWQVIQGDLENVLLSVL